MSEIDNARQRIPAAPAEITTANIAAVARHQGCRLTYRKGHVVISRGAVAIALWEDGLLFWDTDAVEQPLTVADAVKALDLIC